MKVFWKWLRHGRLFEEADSWPVWPFALIWTASLLAILWWTFDSIWGSG